MASLANQTISSTYDGLIKTSTDAPVGVSGVQLLEDGSGNSLALSVGRANNGVTITGNLAVDTNTLYVDAANNRVGIGTSSPDESLELYSNEASVLIANSSGNVNSTSSVKFSNGSTVEPKAAIFFEDTLSNNRGILHLAVNSNTLGTPVSLSDAKLTIGNGGNVGIGESSPAANLEVSGNATRMMINTANSAQTVGLLFGLSQSSVASVFSDVSEQNLIFNTGGSSEAMRIDSSGNVGIGKSPDTLLNIYHPSDSSVIFRIEGSTTSSTGIQFGDTDSSNIGRIIYDHSVDDMYFRVNGSERMRIDSSGNVGINTTATSSSTLRVEGSIAQTSHSKKIAFSKTLSDNVGTDIAYFSSAPSSASVLVTVVINASSGYAVKTKRYLWNIRRAAAGTGRSVVELDGADLGSVNSGVVSIGTVTAVALFNTTERFRLSVDVAGVANSVINVTMEAVGDNVLGLDVI